ncbi:hypothetical protein DNI29_14910 [Hymenobacter sediminis]|uniref:hypothetical protein n=1 Tax=Hymenobacter sediminis TaxID=2218621 RepID=UPI000DA67FC0|nr:hypothetical protein [Hymenobacter sediminis]RPD46290.1 hypothetical protein DNI29_14910 [Hymenobacter sediminis]
MFFVFDSAIAQLEPDLELLRWEWVGAANGKGFQSTFESLIECSLTHRVTQWLADISLMPLVGTDEQAWLSEAWLQHFAAVGIACLAIIEPVSLHNQLVVENVLADGRRYTRVDVQFFSEVEAALDWLASSDEQVQQLEEKWQQGKASQLG